MRVLVRPRMRTFHPPRQPHRPVVPPPVAPAPYPHVVQHPHPFVPISLATNTEEVESLPGAATKSSFGVTKQVTETESSGPAYGSGNATVNRANAQKRGEDVRRKESVGGGDFELDREPFRDPSAKGCPYPLNSFRLLGFDLKKLFAAAKSFSFWYAGTRPTTALADADALAHDRVDVNSTQLDHSGINGRNRPKTYRKTLI